MKIIKWFKAAEAKNSRTAHRAGHRRLGDKYSKCGKVLGVDVTADVGRGWLDACISCDHEEIKESQRAKTAHQMATREGPPERSSPVEAAVFRFAMQDAIGALSESPSRPAHALKILKEALCPR